ncbi:methylated-DNA--[protein]-cysteine S-methyltransferase [Dyella sp. 20L07]|uniref:methylated-DNA--[protein]-cysteine S-methyltransferase n=1 Tax=Dyella sp. 20L07 TaxID=3384240 RepID=UPI003D2C5705
MNRSEKNTELAAATLRDPRWPSVQAHDATADGHFYYSVKTTGVYCRPSCAARPARPENVAFHATRDDAERAGFRPCKRCKPDQEARQTKQTIEHLTFAVGRCSLGALLVARNGRGICAILLGDSRKALVDDLRQRFPSADLLEGDHRATRLLAQVATTIESPMLAIDLPLDTRGTDFQQRVWRALRDIPAGSTASYTDIAHRIGAPRAVRAVAQACAANRLAVVIPCHRVVRSDGALSGYRWGVERKRTLLQREALA